MDVFEQTMNKLDNMSESDRAKTIEGLRQQCICPGCPTYTDCAKNANEMLFCAFGKTSCDFTENGCICPGCPVQKSLQIDHTYYCIRGSEKEQRGKK